jgi:hypothetical protein
MKSQRLDLLKKVFEDPLPTTNPVSECYMTNESNVRSVSTSESDSLVQKHDNVCPLEKVYPSSSGNTTIMYVDAAVQLNIRKRCKYRSKSIQTLPSVKTVSLSPFKCSTVNGTTSPLKCVKPFEQRKVPSIKRQCFASSSVKHLKRCDGQSHDTSYIDTDTTETSAPETSDFSELEMISKEVEDKNLQLSSLTRTRKII